MAVIGREQSGLGRDGAAQSPSRRDHPVHDENFQLTVRSKPLAHTTGKDREVFLALSLDEELARQEAVARAIEGGRGFARDGARSCALGGVETVGLDLLRARHGARPPLAAGAGTRYVALSLENPIPDGEGCVRDSPIG